MSTLFDLNEHLRRIVALNFPQPIWVSAELAQVGESRGHFYLELVQKAENDDVVAQAQAVIWAKEYRQMLSKLGLVLQGLLRQGLELKLLVRPEFHERYGLKLHIVDIDPAYTLGQLDMQRRQTVQALRDRGLFDKNRSLALPLVIQRLAIISSETAAGLQDFQRQLEDNSLGYQFEWQLFPAAVQGKNAEQEICAALARIAAKKNAFDAVVMVRGGGSRLDLNAFDSLDLCTAVANHPLPVFTGIGHDVDESVLDLIANRALKTPTAVAEFVLQHNLLFEGEVLEAVELIRDFTEDVLHENERLLQQAITETRWAARHRMQSEQIRLGNAEQVLPGLAQQLLRNHSRALDQAETYCMAMHPEAVLRRGFSLTKRQGKTVLSAADIIPGDILETHLKEGVLRSEVLPNGAQ